MQLKTLRLQATAMVAGIAVLVFSGWAGADPPSRVARLGYTTGAVSFSPGGENDWVKASLNRPLTPGDRLWVDARARAEIQVGGAMIRMNAQTGVTILNLDDQIAQLQLTQGTLNVRVRRLDRNQIFEVDTPNLAFTLRQAGEYRIDVDPDGNETTIVMRKGQGEVYGEGASYVIDSRQPYRFTGTDLRDYDYFDAPRTDDFDRWASDRDRRYDSSASARYVSPDVIGYEDLDANGTWRADATYGHIWFPNRVASGWAPYRDGHWAWVDPWGWTWVDDAPWGFAVSHYGRWTNQRGAWGWVPGPVRTRAYYAPALVAFVGGDNFQLAISSGNTGGVAWFPLAPREVYRPSYAVSRGYFENVNRSNTVVTTTVINNYYGNTNVANVEYANRQVQGAIIAVPTAAFVQSQPVARAAVQVSRETIVSAPVAFVPRVAPTERSVRGAAADGGKPPGRIFERPVVARTAPPAAHAGFAAQQQQLAAKPGNPLDEAARKALKPAAVVPAPVVKVVVPAQVAPPTAAPPRVAPGGKPGNGRKDAAERKAPLAPVPAVVPLAPVAPVAPPASATPRIVPPAATPVPAAATPAPAAQPAEQRGRPDQRGKAEPRAQSIAPPTPASPASPPSPRASEPAAIAPKAVPVAPAIPEARGKSEQRGKGDQRAAPASPISPAVPTPPAPRAAEPKVVAPPVTQPAPAAPIAESRGKAEPRGKGETRQTPVAPTPPPQRAIEPKVVPPQVVPVPAAQPPRARPESAPPPAKRVEPPQAAPKAVPTPAQPAPAAAPPAQEPKPAVREPKGNKKDKKQDDEEQKRDEENRQDNKRK